MYASAQDVADGFRPLTAAENLVVVTLLQRAGLILQAAVPSLTRRVADGSLSTELVVVIEAAMVTRVLRNPEGKRQVTTSIDDYTHSWTLDSALSTGGLYATEGELASLALPSSGAFRIGTARLGIGLP